MNPGLVIKLSPTGPWRIGPDSGARNQVDAIYHSDSVYAAVTSAMSGLGLLDDWLGATVTGGAPVVSFSSCFPFVGEIGFVVPPRTVWPPSSPALLSARLRWKSARFVPLGIVSALLSGQVLDDTQWSIDGASACLVPAGKPGPFRQSLRFNAAVDRLTGAAERHSVACVEFQPGAGLWTIASFADEAARDRWSDSLKMAFRLLADSGFGGERSRGWGRAAAPDFTEGVLPEIILPPSNGNASQAQWLLSLFVPAPAESVDWDRGNYTLLTRGGRVESPAGGGLKKQIQMVAEGSVLYSASALHGSAPDVSPDGFPHPVYRSGFAVSIPVPEVI